MMTTMDGTELRAPADDVGAADTVDALVERLYHAEAPRLVQMARWFVDDTTAAEDLVQEAFIRLSHNGHRIREQDRAAAYLRSIVINLARDHNRRGLVSLRHRPPAHQDERSAEDHAARREDIAEVVAALRDLPRRQRDCVVLRYYLDLPVDDIAETLGVSRNSVKTHLSRGLKNLSAQLGDLR
jgi:RNA polymerase sigma-70 factor (sigma-E family)